MSSISSKGWGFSSAEGVKQQAYWIFQQQTINHKQQTN
jgi:hypothetical protein